MTENELGTLLAALADPTRRKALALLGEGGELCVCELMERLGVTQSRMSRHMAGLKSVGLVSDRRDAQWVRYRRTAKLDKDTERVVEAVLAATRVPSRKATIRKPTRAIHQQGVTS
jgi:ArsR family transcriptional regulator, arsenate/arsenite/antimonite-responsive transcriptional repressor